MLYAICCASIGDGFHDTQTPSAVTIVKFLIILEQGCSLVLLCSRFTDYTAGTANIYCFYFLKQFFRSVIYIKCSHLKSV